MRSSTPRLVTLGAIVVLAGAAFFVWNWFGPSSHAPASVFSPGGGIGDSSQQVSASVTTHKQMIVVTLHIRPGWHVNANPASLDYLIPTSVSVESDGATQAVQARYPPGKNSGIVIDGTDIQVYDDGTAIPLSGVTSLAGRHIVVHAQACSTKGVCLPPANIVASLDESS